MFTFSSKMGLFHQGLKACCDKQFFSLCCFCSLHVLQASPLLKIFRTPFTGMEAAALPIPRLCEVVAQLHDLPHHSITDC